MPAAKSTQPSPQPPHLASFFFNLSPLFPPAKPLGEDRGGDGIPIKGHQTHGKEIRALGILLPQGSQASPPVWLFSGMGGGCRGVLWPWTPHMSNAKQQEVSLSEAGQWVGASGLCAHALGGGESAEIPAHVCGQGHRQAVTICCCPERPGQGPSTLEDKPSFSLSLLVFPKNLCLLSCFTLTTSLLDKHILPILQKRKWRFREGE